MIRSSLTALALLAFAGGAAAANVEGDVPGQSAHPAGTLHKEGAAAATVDGGAAAGDMSADMSMDSDDGMLSHESTDDNDPGDAGGRTLEKERAEVDTVDGDGMSTDMDMSKDGMSATASHSIDWDANDDGVIDQSEWQANFNPDAEAMTDLNGNGTVNEEEFSAAMFAKVDADGSGVLEESEITTGFLDTQRGLSNVQF